MARGTALAAAAAALVVQVRGVLLVVQVSLERAFDHELAAQRVTRSGRRRPCPHRRADAAPATPRGTPR